MSTIYRFLAIFLTATSLEFARSQNFYCGDVSAKTLVLTVVLFRHGARTPVKTYPNDPYQADYWRRYGGFGALLPLGKQQHYLFGKWFRNCYGSFLNATYNPNEVYVRSSDFDRTLQSVSAHLAGVYPPAKDVQAWSGGDADGIGKLWDPIPIHTISTADDYLIISHHKGCLPYRAMVDDVWANSPEIREKQAANQALLNAMAEKAGYQPPGKFRQISDTMGDAVYVERRMNLALPSWLNQTMVDKLLEWKDIPVHVYAANDTIVRYAVGELAYNLKELFINKTLGKLPQKHIIYSGHDTTLAALFGAYGAYKLVTPYAAGVMTELHYDEAEKRYFVKVFYRNDSEADPIPIKVRTCGKNETTKRCYLEDFINILEPFMIKDKKSACNGASQSGSATAASKLSSTQIMVIIIVIAVVFILLVCALAIYFWRSWFLARRSSPRDRRNNDAETAMLRSQT